MCSRCDGRSVEVQHRLLRHRTEALQVIVTSTKRALVGVRETAVVRCWCRRGRHRSVAVAEMLATLLGANGYDVQLRHLSMEQHGEHGHVGCPHCVSGTGCRLDEDDQALLGRVWGQPGREMGR
jgi:hypothetical protein